VWLGDEVTVKLAYIDISLCFYTFYSTTHNSVPMWRSYVTWAVVTGSLGPSESSMPVSVPRDSPAAPTAGSVFPWMHYR